LSIHGPTTHPPTPRSARVTRSRTSRLLAGSLRRRGSRGARPDRGAQSDRPANTR